MIELYQQANAYRLHQDNLRWTLFAGYSAFFAGVAQFSDAIKAPTGIGLVVVANLFLLVLAVESWYYNGAGRRRVPVRRRSSRLRALPHRWRHAGRDAARVDAVDAGATPFLVAGGARVFCRGVEPSAASRTSAQLWVSDGTAAGTLPLRDLRRGLADARFARMTALGSDVVFVADDGLVGLEPWRSDGTTPGTRVAANVNASTGTGRGSAPTFFLSARQATVFDADDGQLGRELWRTDATAAGTALLRDLTPGSEGSRLIGLGSVRDDALFVSAPGSGRADYYATDGSAAGTRQLRLPFLLNAPVASTVTLDPGRAVFTFANRLDGFGSSPQDWTLLRVAPEGLSAVASLGLNQLPRDLALVGAVPFFAATSPLSGYELWTVRNGLPQPVGEIRPARRCAAEPFARTWWT